MAHQQQPRKIEVQEFEHVYKISEASKTLAKQIATRYIRGLFSNQLSNVPYQLDNDLDLKDLVDNLRILSEQIENLASIGYEDDIPCLVIGTSKIPVNSAKYIANPDFLPQVLAPNEIMQAGPGRQLITFVRNIKNADNRRFTTVSRRALEQSMTSTVQEFVLVRQASSNNREVRQSILNNSGGGSSGGGGGGAPGFLTIDLTTATSSLDIQSSPAYFINWDYFGSPSKHVVGYLKPGKFIFAGSGPSLPALKVSSLKIPIPPNFKVTVSDI